MEVVDRVKDVGTQILVKLLGGPEGAMEARVEYRAERLVDAVYKSGGTNLPDIFSQAQALAAQGYINLEVIFKDRLDKRSISHSPDNSYRGW